MRVLVAEDSMVQRRLLVGLLKQLSMEAVEAANGEEALVVLSRPDGPRLALIDWEMPGLDGIELCRRVRAMKHPIRPHLILVTARDSRADVVQALQAGADDYLTKPPDVGELLARVRVGLRNVQLQQELQARITELESTLRRLDVVGTIAARSEPAPASTPPADCTLTPALWALDGIRRIPERLETLLSGLGESQGDEGHELWAHVALGLPDQGAWVDLVLVTGRARMRSAFTSLTGRTPGGDQELLDTLSDLLGMVLKGVQHHLDEHRVPSVRPLPPRAFVGTGRPVAGAHLLRLERSECTLSVLETPSARRVAPFATLVPGLVLLEALHPPGLPDVEVLPRGTLLKSSYLQRAGPFFQASPQAPVEVMPASAFTVAQAALAP
jgi:CheY-like chemotaxis protein